MGIMSWLVVGAVAGYLARFLTSGDKRLGVVGHIVLGIVGALIGGFLAGIVIGGDYVSGINLTTVLIAVVGAVIALAAWGAVTRGNMLGRSP